MRRIDGLKILGLTGGIATGKSAVSGILREAGGLIIDADAINHENMRPGGPAFAEILAFFGPGILAAGEIDRKKFGAIVFADREKLRALEIITHGHIISRTEEILEAAKGRAFAVIDAPLLIESGVYKICGEVWLMKCREETRVARLMARSGLSEPEARGRIAAQTPFDELAPFADRIIENDGNMAELREKTMDCLNGFAQWHIDCKLL